MKLCTICEWRRATRKLRCDACYRYLKRRGYDRPEHLIVRHSQRWTERGETA